MLASAFVKVGSKFIDGVESIGAMGILLLRCAAGIATPTVNIHRIIRQIHFIGARSALIIILAGVCTGMVLSLQFYDTLVRLGSVELIGSAVGLSLVRELGPVMTALMATGRAGSAMCAELGIMRGSEQVDALECMGIDPCRFLLVPKLIAGLISLPLLTTLFDLAGIAGGYFVAVSVFGIDAGVFSQGLTNGIEWRDLNTGLVKSVAFGGLLVWICSAKGFLIHRSRDGALGAEGVSRTTTQAVVISSVAVLFSDFMIGAVML